MKSSSHKSKATKKAIKKRRKQEKKIKKERKEDRRWKIDAAIKIGNMLVKVIVALIIALKN
jgi:hypothetical protein